MSDERLRVLLIDDEKSLREPLEKFLEGNFGYWVDAVASGEEGLRQVQEAHGQYDVALIDEVLLEGPDGIETMQQIKALYPNVEVIIFTGWGPESKQRAIRAGAFRYLEKPVNNDELAMLIRTAAQQVRLRDIGRAILAEREPDQVLASIGRAACSLALADDAAIVLLDPATGKLRVYSNTYAAEQQWQKHFQDQNLSREIIRTGQVVQVPDTAQDERVNPQVAQTGIRSFVGLPIPGEGGNLGALYVYSQKPMRFEEWGTVAVLQTLAGQAGLAITNAQAFHQVRAHACYMEALVQAGQGLTKATHLEEQLALAWGFVREQLEVSTFFVGLFDREADVLTFPLAYDEGQPIEIPERILGGDPKEWGAAGYVVKTGQELYWPTQESSKAHCLSLGIKGIQIGKPCQSCFYLPLKAGNQVTGVVSIQSYSSYAFTPILLDACRALGSQLSEALENRRLFSELVETKEWREALIENAFDAVVAIDRNKRITVFNQRAEEMFGRTAEEMSGRTVARLHVDVSKAQEIFDIVDKEGAISGWKVELKHRDDTPIPALLSATLIRDSGGRPIGQAGFMRDLRKVNLLEERQQALMQVSQTITSTLELDTVLERVIQAAVAAFPAAQAGAIHLYDERSGDLCLRANTFGYSPSAAEALCFKAGEGIAGWVFQNRQPAVVDDAFQDPRYKWIEHPEVSAHRSMVCVPLEVRGQVIGALSLNTVDSAGVFHADDLGLLTTFADQAAIAIDNARRMHELEQMRRAAEAMARVFEPPQALQQIARSARQVLEADSSAIWSYDQVLDQFIPEELVAVGIPPDELERFRQEEPKPGRTADTVMQRGYIAVQDISQPEYEFLGQPTRRLLNRIGVRCFQGIALRVGEESLGVLYVNYKHTKTLGEEEEATLRTFASHAALALKNARLLTQMERTRRATEVIARVTVQEDLHHTLTTIAQHTRRVLSSDAVNIYEFDEDAGQFGEWTAEIVDARDPGSVRPADQLTRESVVWSILNLDGPDFYTLAEDRVSQHELLGGHFVTVEEIRAAIGLQLRAGGRRLGVMFVNFRSPHRFTFDEIATIQLFADQAAVAIWNARLFQAEQRRVEELSGLHTISQAIGSLTDIQEVYQRVNESMAMLIGAEMCAVLLYDEAEKTLVCQLPMYGVPEEIGKQYRIPVDEGEAAAIWMVDDHLILNDVGQSPLVAELGLGELVQEAGLRDTLLVKLTVGNRDIGIVQASNKLNGTVFTRDDARLLRIFANQAAAVIENAGLYEDLKKTRGLVEARTVLAWMGMDSSSSRHAINNHARTIREQIQLLHGDLKKVRMVKQRSRVADRLSMIERLATKILEKPITPPLSTEEGMDLVPVNALIGERARQLWQSDPYKRVTLRLDLCLADTATVWASPEWLRRAFDILVDNAVDAVADCEKKEVTIGTRMAGGGVEIFVSDTGPGIPQEIQARIGLRLIKPEDAKGLGMGLLIAQAIAQTYGGEIRVLSSSPSGATVAIWLPPRVIAPE